MRIEMIYSNYVKWKETEKKGVPRHIGQVRASEGQKGRQVADPGILRVQLRKQVPSSVPDLQHSTYLGNHVD
jgi:hypothetical protein